MALADSAIREVNRVSDTRSVEMQTLDVLTSLKSLLKKNGGDSPLYSKGIKKESQSGFRQDKDLMKLYEREKFELIKKDLGYFNDISDAMKKQFEGVLAPLTGFFKSNIIGVGIKRLYRSITNTSEEEMAIKKKQKKDAKEKLSQLREEERMAKKNLKSIGITGDYRKHKLRDSEGKLISKSEKEKMSDFQIIKNLNSQYGLLVKDKEKKTKEQKKIEKFLPRTNPTKAQIAKTEAGQALIWKENEENRKEKKPGMFDWLFKDMFKGGLGAAGGVLSALLRGGGLIAIAAGLVMMTLDGIKGYFLAKKWNTSKVSAGIGGFLGGTGKGMSGAFANMGKWALIGAGIGTLAIPIPIVGTIIGGLLGAAVGGILGYIGGQRIAQGIDFFGKLVSQFVVGLPGLAKIGATAGLGLGPPGVIMGALLGMAIEGIMGLFMSKKDIKGFDNMINSFFAKILNWIGDLAGWIITKGATGDTWDKYTEKSNTKRETEAKKEADKSKKEFLEQNRKAGINKLTEAQQQELDNKYVTRGLDVPAKQQNYNGGVAMTSGWAHLAEKEPEFIIPQSKIEKGFDNKYVNNILDNINKPKEIEKSGIINAIQELTAIMKEKNYTNVISTPAESSFDFDKFRVATSYNKG